MKNNGIWMVVGILGLLFFAGIVVATTSNDENLPFGRCGDERDNCTSRRYGEDRLSFRMEYRMNGDLDNDSIANCEDPDDDGDGINDTEDEYPHDHDNDGIPDCRDDDDDNDGVLDADDDDYVGNTSGCEGNCGNGPANGNGPKNGNYGNRQRKGHC